MKRVIAIAAVFFLLCGVLDAQVPHYIHFQGYLTDSADSPLSGTYVMVFRIYDIDSGGSHLWEETHNSVSVTDGYYDVVLGSVTALNLSFDAQYYLALEVNADGEMSPRYRMCAAPYAIRAETAEDSLMLAGENPSYYLDWSNLSGVPATFPPSAHNHDGIYAPVDDSRFLTSAEKTELTGGGDCTLHTHAGMGAGDITAVNVTAPLTGGGSTGDVSVAIAQAGAASDGYLGSADWNTFNAKADSSHTHAGGDITSAVAQATNADTVDGFHANASPTANQLLPLDGTGKFPASAVPSGGGVETPIGSIVAWASSLTGVPSLPEGWVECNGQTLSDPASPLDGQTIPNLNGENRFLRGNSTTGGTGGSETHSHSIPGDNWINGGNGCSGTQDLAAMYKNGLNTNDASSLPPYYEVVWIMRVK